MTVANFKELMEYQGVEPLSVRPLPENEPNSLDWQPFIL